MHGLKARLSRACLLLHAAAGLAAAAVSACVAPPGATRQATPLDGPAALISGRPASAGRKISILLPLTGPNAELGQAMLKAAQLALSKPGSPELDQQDTAGTPEGATNAARAALAAGAGLIIGPLTAPETSSVIPIARAAGVPMLPFTSDISLAQPGVWPMGIAPAQQVRRLVLATVAENKTKLAALVPQNIFGEALASAALATAASASMPEPKIARVPNSFSAMNDALKDISSFATRRGAIEAQQRAARARNDADGRREAAEIGKRTPDAPPMDALLLGVTGELLGQVVPLLTFYDIGPGQVRILGPGTWAREAARQPGLSGAWFAAPDPARRAGFEKEFAAKFGVPAREYTSLAYDAAGIARIAGSADGFSLNSIQRAEGFVGADGLIGLSPDGQVRRGLAIFEVDRGGSHIVQPAPQTLSAPGV